MDHAVNVCVAFPSEAGHEDLGKYERAAPNHLRNVQHLMQETSLRENDRMELLALMDPSYNSLSYAVVLHDLCPSPGKKSFPPRELLLEKLVIFLATFEPIQLRYAGPYLSDLLSVAAQYLPPSVAVDTLATAILRIDSTGSMLTSAHTALVKLAYKSGVLEPALPVIDKHIIFFPGMANHEEPIYLCDPELSPPSYISKQTGLTTALKTMAVLEYDLVCGLIYISLRDWAKAHAALARVVNHPSRESYLSKIMVEAYKKLVLVSLLLHGVFKQPDLANTTLDKQYTTLAKAYIDLGLEFATGAAETLKAEAESKQLVWKDDANLGLVREVLAAYQKWQILYLKQVYTKISIAEVGQLTTSAETGRHLPSDQDVEELIVNMIASGMLKGTIQKNDEGVRFLVFLSSAPPTEREYAVRLAQTTARMMQITPALRSTLDRLGTHKEYIRHIIRNERRAESQVFETQVEDEDLMNSMTDISRE